jgi:hypothetical protein
MPPHKLKPWTAIHEKKYTWLYNYLIDNTNIKSLKTEYIDLNKRMLSKYIDGNTKWSDGSKEGLYFMIARYLYNKKDIKNSTRYSQFGHDLTIKNNEKEEKNELDEKEKEFYRPHSYFENIINNINKDEITTIEAHYRYLLLNILVKQPPLRTSFYTTAKIIRSKDDNDKKNNFILINRRGKIKVQFIVNIDKASNYKMFNMNPNLSKIDIDDNELAIMINDSYVKYPRNYLFELKEKPISQNTLLNWLRKITDLSGVNIDIMRSSFITWFYEHNLTFGVRDKLSRMMRHSQSTAQKNYNKVFDNDINDSNIIDELNEQVTLLTMHIKELKDKLSVYESNKEDDMQYKKRKSDVIYNLNVKKRIPRDDTLKKYDIIYNKENNLYT